MVWKYGNIFRTFRCHSSLKKFEEGLKKNDPGIAPSMIYAYAALKMGIPYAKDLPT
ncbi:MAG: hypothetical protein CM1200mP10_00740 [Candidatus Neomarinimicrobiota bacterium]|nr:MAG: hypothetical protein CM1200mP10_00740 [Candidatus Neomarinimicrobiota bacterium]